jgi:hypothetical protein
VKKKLETVEFEHDGRTYRCRPEMFRSGGEAQQWWWFDVSGDRQRYAPFRAAADDTERSVRARVVAYYDEVLARRAAPSVTHGWRRGAKPVTTSPETATAAKPS